VKGLQSLGQALERIKIPQMLRDLNRPALFLPLFTLHLELSSSTSLFYQKTPPYREEPEHGHRWKRRDRESPENGQTKWLLR
jgi:hypothetical protein